MTTKRRRLSGTAERVTAKGRVSALNAWLEALLQEDARAMTELVVVVTAKG
jgi:hypothetical protein